MAVAPQWFVAAASLTAMRLTSSGLLLVLLAILIGLLSCTDRPTSTNFVQVLFYAMFTRLPIRKKTPNINQAKKEDIKLTQATLIQTRDDLGMSYENTKTIKYVYVDYNAWEFAGSDNLWAGLVTKLVDEIEAEFGVVTTRVFRTISLDTKCKVTTPSAKKYRFCSHLVDNPKTTFMIPNILLFILCLLVIIVLPIIATYVIKYIPTSTKSKSTPTTVSAVVTRVISFLPLTVATLVTVGKLIWAMLFTQRQMITSTISGTKGNLAMELGFMKKVKNEVHTIVDLIRTVEFINDVEYKIIIAIDDLDRIQLSQVKSVLEAVSILLSDRSSPFVCLIAVDSRVAVKCIEEDMGTALLEVNVNGHEYLKKIINLPFCLPEISSEKRKRYTVGLIKQADDTCEETPRGREEATDTIDDSNNMTLCDFMFKCRETFYGKTVQSFLTGNPRQVKRLFNVISVTCMIIHGFQEASGERLLKDSLAEQIVAWVIGIEQWPDKMRHILQTITNLETKIAACVMVDYGENDALLKIYKKHCKESTNAEALTEEDVKFEDFLMENTWLTARIAKSYLPYTINLHPM
uniref:kinase D-interacting substrate of 220 kDa-like n=1 Tax=Ciona intestinalis TaxID=7719 RepID=UPI000180C7CC|nr:kinase D-interacting substrate of 220 kDa-like [Ciona intestinalis]|eukprot:XP_018669844.1 kinase D-interacting substrate of 220 kDa-like [Ciona intestinalis]